jgi:hypothetical protein
LSPQEVEGYYLDLMRLKGMDDFVNLYDRVKDILPDLIAFYESYKSKGHTIDELEKLKCLADESQEAESRLSELLRNEQNAQNSLDDKVRLLKVLEIQERDLESNNSMMSNQREFLKQEISDAQSILDSIKSHDAYQENERMIQNKVSKILDSNSRLLDSALVSVMIAFVKYPYLQELLIPPYDEIRGNYLINDFQKTALPILVILRGRILENALVNIYYELKKRAKDSGR